jgi:3-oxoacyl-[acyl-carrier-protein] synthase-3
VPEGIIDNACLAKRLGISQEAILKRTGIEERRYASNGMAASDLGLLAAQQALHSAKVKPEEIDLVVCSTYTPDMSFPSTACIIQDKLGAKRAGAFDLQAACSGFVYGLITASQFIITGLCSRILLVASDVNSSIVDSKDYKVSSLFGDGAGAVVLGPVPEGIGILSHHFGSDGSGGHLFYRPAGGSRLPASHETVEKRLHYIQMDGQNLFRFGVATLVNSSMKALKQANLQTDHVDLFIPHQANLRIIKSGIKRLNIPLEKTYINIHKYGNTASATIPIALDETVRSGRLKKDDVVLLTGFGAGLTWASVVLKWV